MKRRFRVRPGCTDRACACHDRPIEHGSRAVVACAACTCAPAHLGRPLVTDAPLVYRSVGLTGATWQALESFAHANGSTVAAELRGIVAEFLAELPPSSQV